MDLNIYSKIDKQLKNSLTKKRYIHTIGVAYTSAALAMKYGCDVDKALLAGLLHDCAKCFTDEEKFDLCREGSVELNEFEIRNTALIHAKLGVYIARRDYGVEDPEVLEAIRTHTTGEPGMSLLQKIVYVADITEPNRAGIPGLEMYREKSFENLDECIFLITSDQLEYLALNTDKEIDPMTKNTFEYYKEQANGI